MVRKAIFKHATYVNPTTYPDDGSPVGTTAWNEAPDSEGMLGFSPQTATITITSGVATITDSITVVAAEGGTSDTLDKLAITNTNEYDLVYLFANSGDDITLTNTSSPSADGHIKTVSNSNETLSSTSPTILIRKGNYWYGYGGGVVNAVSDIGDVTITTPADNDLLAYDNTSSEWINQTPAQAGLSETGHTHSKSDITNFDNEVSSNSAVAANTAKITNATHTGDVTGSTTLSIASDVVGATELGVTAGTATASKALVVDANKDLTGVRNLTVAGDLTVDGTNTILNTQTLEIEDKDIFLAKVSNPSNITANGAGIIIEAGTDVDKSILWDSTNSNFTSTEHVNIASGKSFKVNNTELKDVPETLTNKSIDATQLTGTIADARMPDLTGEVTTTAGAVATTIADDIIDEANLKVDNAPTDDYVLTAKSSATGGLTWKAGGGGAEVNPVLQLNSYSAANQSPSTEGTDKVSIFVKTINSNNQGLYIRIKKNGNYHDVQIA